MKNETTDLLVFPGVFYKKDARAPRESFAFISGYSYVIVTIDHTQNGEEDKLLLYSDSIILAAILDLNSLFEEWLENNILQSVI